MTSFDVGDRVRTNSDDLVGTVAGFYPFTAFIVVKYDSIPDFASTAVGDLPAGYDVFFESDLTPLSEPVVVSSTNYGKAKYNGAVHPNETALRDIRDEGVKDAAAYSI